MHVSCKKLLAYSCICCQGLSLTPSVLRHVHCARGLSCCGVVPKRAVICCCCRRCSCCCCSCCCCSCCSCCCLLVMITVVAVGSRCGGFGPALGRLCAFSLSHRLHIAVPASCHCWQHYICCLLARPAHRCGVVGSVNRMSCMTRCVCSDWLSCTLQAPTGSRHALPCWNAYVHPPSPQFPLPPPPLCAPFHVFSLCMQWLQVQQ